MNSLADMPGASRWIRFWSLGTLCAAFTMLLLGGVVTTFRVGMADPIWPTYPWHLLLIDWREPSAGFLIEHVHRLMGHILGFSILVLAVGVWSGEARVSVRRGGYAAFVCMIVSLAMVFWLKKSWAYFLCLGVSLGGLCCFGFVAARTAERGAWVRWLAMAALSGVIFQGMLGGLRVEKNALVGPELAAVHGCLAQVMFAVIAALAWLSSSQAMTTSEASDEASAVNRMRRLSTTLVGLVLVQLVLGALIRHRNSLHSSYLHFLVALGVLAHLLLLYVVVATQPAARRDLSFMLKCLICLVGVQFLLGLEAWVMRFASGPYAEWQPVGLKHALVRTAHVLLGSVILALAAVLALRVRLRASRSGVLSPETAAGTNRDPLSLSTV